MKEKIDYTVLKDRTLTREQIAEWLHKDIEGVYILLAEFLRSTEVKEAIVEVYWKRYQQMVLAADEKARIEAENVVEP